MLEERDSSSGISFSPTEKRVRSRFGSLINRSDTLGGIVARTLVLYTITKSMTTIMRD